MAMVVERNRHEFAQIVFVVNQQDFRHFRQVPLFGPLVRYEKHCRTVV
jgi:hypothetical protein